MVVPLRKLPGTQASPVGQSTSGQRGIPASKRPGRTPSTPWWSGLRNQAYDLAMGGNVRVLIWLLESQERKAASGSSSTEERIGQIEIIGLKEGESRDGDFIEFVES